MGIARFLLFSPLPCAQLACERGKGRLKPASLSSTDLNEREFRSMTVSQVTLYTTMMCPYCSQAKTLLSKKNVNFDEIDVGMDPDLRKKMQKRSGGARTVPQIFVGDIHIGGCDDLYALERAGKLDQLLAAG